MDWKYFTLISMKFIKLQLDYGSNIGYVPLDVIQDLNQMKTTSHNC